MYDLPYSVGTEIGIFNDTSSRVSEPLRSTFPDLLSDSASKDLPGRILLDIDNDTESTALWRKPRPRPAPFHPGEQNRRRCALLSADQTVKSLQWREEKVWHAGLRLPTAPGEGGGWHFKLNDLCLEVGFLYTGKKPCQKNKKKNEKEKSTQNGKSIIAEMCVGIFVTAVEAGGTKGNLEWRRSSAWTIYLIKYMHYANRLLPATWTFILIY